MSKEDSSSLLAKMAKFVRNPGLQWTEAGDSGKEGGAEAAKSASDAYSKQELKDIIEQRRRNDFVRRREFDMLRKVRAAGGAALYDGAGRPSFFETSTPAPLDDRDSTIKKIDDIEALMSEQWSDRKSGARTRPQAAASQSAPVQDTQRSYDPTTPGVTPTIQPSAALAPTEPMPLRSAGSTPLAPTEPMPLRAAEMAYLAPTQPMGLTPRPAAAQEESRPADMLSFQVPQAAPVQAPAAAQTPAPVNPQVQQFQAPTPEAADPGALGPKDKEFVYDIALEEAAIRFASGDDDASVESMLVAALVPGSATARNDEAWMTLFDLYRTIGNQARFETVAIDYAGRFDKSAPTWYSVPELLGKSASGGAAGAGLVGSSAGWSSPVVFGMQSAAALSAALQRLPQPWSLNWNKLNRFDDAALASLEKLVAGWCVAKVQLRFSGAARLLEVVAARAPNGNKTIDQGWWRVHMLLLRLMHRPDDFEIVALEFCVTYELSPPQWEKALCSFKSLDAEGATMMAQATRMQGADSQESMQMAPPQAVLAELSGSLTGDATKAIEQIEAQLEGATLMVVSCFKLARIDFTAAGALLNWAATQQGEGRTVQFRSVNRLVASFFHVIGINEHARILVSTL